MPTFYRLVKARFADRTFDGEGAKFAGGSWNWNCKGVTVAYAANSIALAALELLVHLNFHEILNSYWLCSIEIEEEDLLPLDDRDLPQNWRVDPPPSSTAQVGDGWVESKESLALVVPSVVIPSQQNILINPAHRHFDRALKTVCVEEFVFDPRLVKT